MHCRPTGGRNAVDADPLAPRVAVNVDGIPEEMRKVHNWICWKLEPPKKPGDKPRKVPKNPLTGRNADTTDPTTWGTFAEARAAKKRFDFSGIGFVFTHTEFAGIDFDDCRNPETGVIDEKTLALAKEFGSYTENSASGTGIHVIVVGKLSGSGLKHKKVEVYDTGRYFAITGVRVDDTPPSVASRPLELEAFYQAMKGERARTKNETPIDQPREESDEALLERALRAHNGPKLRALMDGDYSAYPSQSEADMALCAILAFWCGNDAPRIDRIFRTSGLMSAKWDEMHGAQSYGAGTIAKVLHSSRVPPRTASGPTRPQSGKPPPFVEMPVEGGPPPLTDSGNAERLVKLFGQDLRYCYDWNRWLNWKGSHWSPRNAGKPMLLTKRVARSLLADAANIKKDAIKDAYVEHAHRSEKVDRRKAILTLAQAEPGIPIQPEDLDQHPHLLNCANGTLNLDTDGMHHHRREDYLTKRCPTKYVPDAPCPKWTEFLERVLPDEEERNYLQRFCGHSLSGDVSEHIFLIADGSGANGKSTFFRAIQEVLSTEYAIQISADLLIAKQQRGHPTEVADLFGVRLAIGIETAQSQHLDEPLIKQLTGGDRIRARRMREDFWEFAPTHKLVLVTNHMPEVTASDPAMIRRLHRLNFGVTIPERERNKRLLQQLVAEREGILAWMVRGYRDWREFGLCPPESVLWSPPKTATQMLPPERFITERVVRKLGVRTGANEIYVEFTRWCAREEVAPCSQRDLGSQLGRSGFGRIKTGGYYFYLDLFLTPAPEPERDDEGPKGPSPALISLRGLAERGTGEIVPKVPQGPSAPGDDAATNDASACGLAACDGCGSRRFWCRPQTGETGCATCQPLETDGPQVEWFGDEEKTPTKSQFSGSSELQPDAGTATALASPPELEAEKGADSPQPKPAELLFGDADNQPWEH
jgi:putative DNA primase/helicase